MPQIPRYFSQVVIQPNETPKIPVGLGGQVGEATARAGGAASDIGANLTEKLRSVKQLEEFTKLTIDSDKQLLQLHSDLLSDPEFISDPEGARERFNQQITKIRQAYQGQIKDPEVNTRFQEHFERSVMTREFDIVDAARKQRISSGRATTDQALYEYRNNVAQAKTEQDAASYLGRGVALARQMGALGAYSLEDAQKKEREFVSDSVLTRARLHILNDPRGAHEALLKGDGLYTHIAEKDMPGLLSTAQEKVKQADAEDARLQEKAEKTNKVALEGGLVSDVQSLYPNDPAKQEAHLADTRNYPGIDLDTRKSAISFVKSEGERVRRENDAAQKEIDNSFWDEYLKDGKSDTAIDASDASPDLKAKLKTGNKQREEDRYKTDPATYADVLQQVYDHKIVHGSQLAGYIGQGISVSDFKELGDVLKTAQDPSKSTYFTWSAELFKNKYENNKEMQGRWPEFARLLDHHVRKEDLKGPEIFTRAQELMKIQEQGWFNGFLNKLDAGGGMLSPVGWGTALTDAYLNDGNETPVWKQELKEQPWLQEETPLIMRQPKTSPMPKDDAIPAIQQRVNELRGKMPDEEIAGYLMEKGINPLKYIGRE
jgi:hypothetical protein